ncbi:MAG: adenylosuccinate synthase [Bacteroidales bacterium]|nr:adenylosuccinate synthase [Bacteroidales bacterium]
MGSKVDVVLGLQWGDEGKGKIVDVLAGRYKTVARFQGGPNAGHSLHFDGQSFVVRSIPSGIFREGTVNLIGSGVVLDPISFAAECDNVRNLGIEPESKIVISRKIHLILPTHRLLDAAREAAAGKAKIGSTLKGIGPAYSDKTGRKGLRVGDIESQGFAEKFKALKAAHIAEVKRMNLEGFDEVIAKAEAEEKTFFECIEKLRKFSFVDCEFFVNDTLQKHDILAEGAQGSMLDVDHGSYPFVTSSNTTCGGVCTGLGVAPGRIGKVYGIFKAYCTRVGSGPFPTELFDATGERIRQIGHEFGAVTGRPRRCGWLDLVALRYAVIVNGVTDLIMMKSDCLDSFPTIKACVAYNIGGKETDRFPFDISPEAITPVYREFHGWQKDLSGIRSEDELPKAFKDYIAFIEDYLGVRVSILSVGPDRDANIERHTP